MNIISKPSPGKLIWRDKAAPAPKPQYWVPFAVWARADVARRLEWERWANAQGLSIAVDLTDDATWSLPPAPKEIESDRELELQHGWDTDK